MYQTYRITELGYTVIDTEFEYHGDNLTSLWETIVQAYEKRKLPVVPNLIRAIRGFSRNLFPISTPALFDHIMSTPYGNLEKYKPELEKYLILL